MEALTLDRKTYDDALAYVNEGLGDESYISLFKVTFPEGINTANALEICKVINAPTFDNKEHLLRVCVTGKNVEVKCPNGDVEKFCMNNVEDNFEAFPLFVKDPLALMAISDAVYGYILKKSVRLSKPDGAAAKTE